MSSGSRPSDASVGTNSASFDPYHKWLGIPPDEQPANHYRLLAIRVYEADPDVIEAAAVSRSTYVRQCATGPHADASQQVLNDLSAAQICLLNSEQKAAYDAQLKSEQEASAEQSATGQAGEQAPTEQKAGDSKSKKLDKQKKQIETLLEKCEFATAISALEKMAALKTPKAAKYVKWAKQQLPKAKSGTQNMRESTAAMYRTATDLFDRNDFEEAAEILQQIPQKFRDKEISQLLQECLDLQEEIAALQDDIDHAESLKKYDDLRPTVERLLEIKPNDRRARKLLKELKTYGNGGGMRLGGRGDQRFDAAGNTSNPFKVAMFVGIPLVLFGIVGWLTVSYVRSNDKTIQIEIDDPSATVSIDGKEIRITGVGDTVKLKVGKHELVVKRDDVVVETRVFEVVKGKNSVLKISLFDAGGTPLTPTDGTSTVAANDAETAPPFAAAPFDATAAQQHQHAWAKHLGVPVETTNSIGMNLRLIPPGKFTMGSPQAEIDELVKSTNAAKWHERFRSQVEHEVTLTKPYYLGAHEVTQGQYERAMGSNPAHYSSTGRGRAKVVGIDPQSLPVESVSWLDAVDFCNKLSQAEGLERCYQRKGSDVTMLDGNGYRMPTESEWEFACRAGTQSRWSFGDDEGKLAESGWYLENSEGRPHAVGTLLPNAFGLYDMHGNVSEKCQDWYSMVGSDQPATDPEGPSQGNGRISRGGTYSFRGHYSRSALRSAMAPDRGFNIGGFRVVRGVGGGVGAVNVAAAKVTELSFKTAGDLEPWTVFGEPTIRNDGGLECAKAPVETRSILQGGSSIQSKQAFQYPLTAKFLFHCAPGGEREIVVGVGKFRVGWNLQSLSSKRFDRSVLQLHSLDFNDIERTWPLQSVPTAANRTYEVVIGIDESNELKVLIDSRVVLEGVKLRPEDGTSGRIDAGARDGRVIFEKIIVREGDGKIAAAKSGTRRTPAELQQALIGTHWVWRTKSGRQRTPLQFGDGWLKLVGKNKSSITPTSGSQMVSTVEANGKPSFTIKFSVDLQKFEYRDSRDAVRYGTRRYLK